MQVNSVSSATNRVQSFKGENTSSDFLNCLASIDDNTIRKLAYTQTVNDKSRKRHKRISNAIMWSIPVAAGIASAINKPSLTNLKDLAQLTKIKLPDLNISRLTRLYNFAGTALSWAGTFAVIDLVFGAKNKIDKHSAASREFTEKYPVLSMLGTIGASIAAIYGARAGAGKILNKLAPAVFKITQKDIATISRYANKLNNNKVLNKTSGLLEKVPSAIKVFGKNVLNWSPMLLILTSITHSAGYNRNKNSEFVRNYNDLKMAQAIAQSAVNSEE